MKKAILFLSLFIISTYIGTAQDSKTKKLTCGDKIKLSNGTLENGNFKYIYINSNELLSIPRTYLDASYSNLNVQIIGIKKLGNERLGYKTMLTLWVDEDSIPTCAMNAYKNIQNRIDFLKKDIKERQIDLDSKVQSMPNSIKLARLYKIRELTDSIPVYEVFKEKAKIELNSIRWILDYEAALSSGEIKK